MVRIIDGVLYDTNKCEFVGSFHYNSHSKKYRRGPSNENYYISLDGVMIVTYQNEMKIANDESKINIIKEKMNPKIYAKFWTLKIPGDGVKKDKKSKKSKKMKSLEELE